MGFCHGSSPTRRRWRSQQTSTAKWTSPTTTAAATTTSPRSSTSWSSFSGTDGSSNAGCSSGATHPRANRPCTPPRVKIPPPIFKGLPGERLEAHLMRANEWMDTYNILPVNKPKNFKHTLNHLAREWYDSLTFPIAWNDLQQRFSRYFSTQGQSIKHLHDKWRNFSFTPGQDDIEPYIRDVKKAAHQLNYNDDAVLHLIKATMPAEIYSTLYNQHDLNTVITMVKDIYAKKTKPINASDTASGTTPGAPFTMIKAPGGNIKRVYFQDEESMSDSIERLTNALY